MPPIVTSWICVIMLTLWRWGYISISRISLCQTQPKRGQQKWAEKPPNHIGDQFQNILEVHSFLKGLLGSLVFSCCRKCHWNYSVLLWHEHCIFCLLLEYLSECNRCSQGNLINPHKHIYVSENVLKYQIRQGIHDLFCVFSCAIIDGMICQKMCENQTELCWRIPSIVIFMQLPVDNFNIKTLSYFYRCLIFKIIQP